MKLELTALALLLISCTSTSTSTSSSNALPRGEVVKKLDAGRVESMPTGSVYVRFVKFAQPSGYVINSKQHVPSFVYVETGTQRLVLSGQAPIDLVAGQAVFHQSVTHQHLNAGSTSSVWYSIAVWPSSARGTPLVDPIAQAAFESQDFDRAELPQVAYSVVLRQVTLARSGSSGAHRFGGLASFYVLSGEISIKSAHNAPITLDAGRGVAYLPDTDLQEDASGSSEASYLQFVVTPAGKEFEVPLHKAPGA